MELAYLIPIILVFFVGGLFKGVMGFGLPIIAMSTLPFFVPVEMAIVISVFVQPATNINQLVSSGGYKKAFQITWPVIIFLFPGMFLGSWFITSLDSNGLLIIVGLSIIGFAMIDLLGFRLLIKPSERIHYAAILGSVAGFVGALTSLNGWAFILYLLGIGADRQTFRSAIALLFLVSGILISTGFWAVGWLTPETFLYGLVAIIPSFFGMYLGDKLGRRIPAEKFRNLVLLALIIIGGSITYSAFL